MSQIRPLEREDLDQLATLREVVALSGASTARPGLASHLAASLLDYPWADDALPSLVYCDDDGLIVGFQGVCVRHALLKGRAVRVAYACRAMSHPTVRHRGVGAQLIRRLLGGPQEITITDNATEEMRKLWILMGGQALDTACLEWIRVLRPWQSLGWWLAHHTSRMPRRSRLLSGLDIRTSRLAGWFAPPRSPETLSYPLTPSGLADLVSSTNGGLTFRIDYSEAYLTWLFAELGKFGGLGSPRIRAVRTAAGETMGWYAYYLRSSGTSHVLQIAARPRYEQMVLEDLFFDAWSGGAVAVVGRLEPRLFSPLSAGRVLLRFSPTLALVHTRDPEMLAAVSSPDALLTRMDGEWWMQDRLVPGLPS